MWPEGGSATGMEQARGNFIRESMVRFSENMATANEYRAKGGNEMAEYYERKAWIEYGKALHPIMDSTSPVHNRQWRLGDWQSHGDSQHSQEDMRAAPAYRDETVRRMRNVSDYMR
jgi:hypothetical protein